MRIAQLRHEKKAPAVASATGALEMPESLGASLDVYTKDSPSVIGFKLALKGC